MKFPPNHPQRSYVTKTAEATGLHHRTIVWICKSSKSSTASSSAEAKNSLSITTPSALPASSSAARIPLTDKTSPPVSQKVHTGAIIVDYFDKEVIRRKIIQNQKAVTNHRQAVGCSLADIYFKGCHETFRMIVRILGFREVICQPDRNALKE